MQLIDLKKTIGNKSIIKGLSFDIKAGEVFGFLGPNGAGKTTTIRMMVGLMNITEGDVIIQGKSIKNDYKGAIRHVGAIVENPEMYPFMSGMKNLQHFARMMEGITPERIQEVVSLVGLDKAIHEKAGRYSLGMRQRLGIAQALLHRPSILILDEPTNGLDPSGIREIRKYIRNLAEQENVAVIVSSHLLSEIELMCDRIGIIKNGELIAIESIKSIEVQNDVKDVHIEVHPLESAKDFLEAHTAHKVTVHKKELVLSLTKEQIPKVLKELIHKGMDVYGVRVLQSTLEDKFFDLIGENTIE
ncbi:ABC transporter ATP-binding protein [Planococcus shenhongbingii]|uniref:ABC transporter ATP-binding protein n=1 Tax=Planococcus shenhongbingii TaxID=3058398 RepID=A0ABT8N8N9_9BACL|nr:MULTISPECIES: ABC transporter ATP-binding protein [unclassified Planococcus (in: firmicutes)]MDN7244244.1 ABC transporter ATP-binding protein [Planococcus sp. N017]WKA60489.1 ABC transporter ATP-binding protein [Planococcus sp. N016]